MLLRKALSLLIACGLPAVFAAAVRPQLRTRQTVTNSTDYDYVIVGSGPGGGPLASRLAIAGFKVLLIDAGDDQGGLTDQMVPALQLQSTENDLQKWDYYVQHYSDLTRQKQDSKMVYQKKDGSLYVGLYPPPDATPLGVWYPRAGTLGGCAGHNAMITMYPFESDWTYIQTLTGDDSWNPGNMRSYFEKLERCEYLPNSVVGHGFTGWLGTALTSLTLVVEDQKLLSLIVSAATAFGQNIISSLLDTVAGVAQVLISDLNAPGAVETEGLYQVPLAIDATTSKRNGPRDFIIQTANAVNADGSRRYHLDVVLNTFVTKIRFDRNGSTPRAIGVEYVQGHSLYAADPRYTGASGTPGYVAAGKEVIISGGVYESPKLLKLSGIGPAAELHSFGIDVVIDSPGVGGNLQDRYETTVVGEAPTAFTITKDCTFGYSSPDPCLVQWENGIGMAGKGTYATNGIAIAVVKRSSVAPTSDPDLLISGAPASFKGYYPGYAYDGLGIDAKHWAWITLKAHSHNSAGTVNLTSSDPLQMPRITFNSFDTGTTTGGGDQIDLQAVYEGMEFSRTAFKDLIPLDGSFTETWPGTNVSTEDEVKQFIKNEAWGHHASCTCPIGADGDPMAVLDSSFRVRGVEALRVVDASVFPKIPGFYIALPIYMISEKAADVIIKGAS